MPWPPPHPTLDSSALVITLTPTDSDNTTFKTFAHTRQEVNAFAYQIARGKRAHTEPAPMKVDKLAMAGPQCVNTMSGGGFVLEWLTAWMNNPSTALPSSECQVRTDTAGHC